MDPGGNEKWTLYGAGGEKLRRFVQNTAGVQGYHYTVSLKVSLKFAGEVVTDYRSTADRVGTVRGRGAKYYPYGEMIGPAPSGYPAGFPWSSGMFATYTRDYYSGLDYANQRWYASTYGRFTSADPYQASAGASDPGSWNRYAYTRGDPVNRFDPVGLQDCSPGVDFCATGTAYADRDVSGQFGNGQGFGNGKALVDISGVGNDGPQPLEAIGVGGDVTFGPDPNAKFDNALIRQTLVGLKGLLADDSTCLSWLESGLAMGQASAFDVFYNQLVGGGAGSLTVGGGSFNALTFADTTYKITINANGAFFNSNVGVGIADRHTTDMSGLQGNTDAGRVFILLHELAHYFTVPGFVKYDQKDANQQRNNDMVWDKCAKTIKAASPVF